MLQGALYNYQLKTDANILKDTGKIENRETGESPILKEEVEKAIQMLKTANHQVLTTSQRRF